MKAIAKIESKIEAFISKYYKNQLLRGLIFFVAIGLSYLLISLCIEYFFWLRPVGRTILFWSFILVEILLLVRLIFIPLARLLKLTKGIDLAEASQLIGKHFPEVNDKLINTLQLNKLNNGSDLALASIEQRSKELDPIPFSLAVDYKKNGKYLKFAIIPIIVFLIFNFAADDNPFGSSYKRMVNFSEVYEPPAPFAFFLIEDELKALENQNFIIKVQTQGKQIPEEAQIIIDGQSFYMKQEGGGKFTYTVEQPTKDVVFRFSANDVSSRDYKLKVVKTPLITNFSMRLNYPSYTGKQDEVVTNTGSATVPEGTTISWDLKTLSTENIEWISKDSTYSFQNQEPNSFLLERAVFSNLSYTIATSNTDLNRYESLDYSINVIRDAYPEINVEKKTDTITGQQDYFYGKISDDYGLNKLRLVFYPQNDDNSLKYRDLYIENGVISQFTGAFPDTLSLTPGISYNYYFEVSDNDRIHNYKKSKSEIFTYHKMTVDEVQKEQLQDQEKTIK
ncbi:MAG: DUF4175 family protein, partial [Leeuwenhoekiella sp.]